MLLSGFLDSVDSPEGRERLANYLLTLPFPPTSRIPIMPDCSCGSKQMASRR